MIFSSELVGRRVELKACEDNPHLNTEKHGTVTGGDENFTYILWNDGIRQQVLNTEFYDSFMMVVYCPYNKATVPYVPKREFGNIRFLNN